MTPSAADPRALPPPTGPALSHSRRLADHIAAEIAANGGAIPFAHYMELALYAPGLGYYSAGSRKFGPEGDFITAPELSLLFGQTLARQCGDLLSQLGPADLLECGAGSGALACQLLQALEAQQQLPQRYLILEVSADLRDRQRQRIATELPHLLAQVEWIDQLPEQFSGVVVANELIDALPAQRFHLTATTVEEFYVTASATQEGPHFAWALRPADAQLTARAETLRSRYPLAEGYISELNLAGEAWLRTLAERLTRGAILLIDYGFPEHEFYHPQRGQGTLMCHYRHRAHDDPFLWPGLADITTHVDFTALAEAAHGAGLSVAGFSTQGHFLLSCGLLDQVGEMPEEMAQRLQVAGEIRRLTGPEEMGELFKVLALTRGLTGPLRGFALRDDRHRL